MLIRDQVCTMLVRGVERRGAMLWKRQEGNVGGGKGRAQRKSLFLVNSSLQILPFTGPEDQTPESSEPRAKDASKKCNFFNKIVEVRP